MELPELSCLPILSKYPNVETYLSIFSPLLMHEMWSSLARQHHSAKKDKKYMDWKLLIKSYTVEDVFLLLDCVYVLEDESEVPAVNDLVVLAFHRPSGETMNPFAIIEEIVMTKLIGTADLDRRLVANKKAKFLVQSVIRILKVYSPKQMNIICEVGKIASLTSSLRLFQAQAGLGFSFLRDIILDPRPPPFTMLAYSQHCLFGGHLDETQKSAYFCIAQTMLITPPNVPKVALLQGYPGIFSTFMSFCFI